MSTNQGSHLAEVDDRQVIAEIFAEDVRAEDNRGVIGYDYSPEVLAQAHAFQKRIEEQFQSSH